jgi:hypothetical protein
VRCGDATCRVSTLSPHYRGKTFQSLKGHGSKSNYYELQSGEEYWISGCKKDGGDRLYNERVPIEIDEDAREE